MSGIAPSARKVVSIDFDDCIAPWGGLFEQGDPFPGVVGEVRRLADAGWTIVILTSRMSTQWWRDAHEGFGFDDAESFGEANGAYVAAYLNRHGIPHHQVTAEKRPSQAYLDDRAFRIVNGDFTQAVDMLLDGRL